MAAVAGFEYGQAVLARRADLQCKRCLPLEFAVQGHICATGYTTQFQHPCGGLQLYDADILGFSGSQFKGLLPVGVAGQLHDQLALALHNFYYRGSVGGSFTVYQYLGTGGLAVDGYLGPGWRQC